ncbi:hypothetical protein [Ensifer soli]|uniref:hypothetical protein n=1 Tax=Ciceribacter sp. sgz301302 TaxID=3342379 RepID=UPI0035B6E933
MPQTDTESQIAALRSDVARLQKQLSAQTADVYHDLRDRADSAVRSAMPGVKQAAGYVKSEGSALAETARQHPAGLSTVVALAGVVGLAVGFLLGASHQEPPPSRWRSWR